jgi:hypothetical protein
MDRPAGGRIGRVGAVPVQCLPVDEIVSKLQERIDVMMLGLEPGLEGVNDRRYKHNKRKEKTQKHSL